jgi:2-amino-4-hydroxy-6-hydroxymethyldihydropteridine diphosphokinase
VALNGDKIILTGLKVRCIIGIFDWERRQKQDVVIDLRFPADVVKSSRRDDIRDAMDYKKIAKAAIAFVRKSRFRLIETLAEELAGHLMRGFGLQGITLRVSKPGAVRGSKDVGVEITRGFPKEPGKSAYLSLGSNVQPRVHLSKALRRIGERYVLKSLSHVYETSPIGGKKGQPFFWNMAAEIGAVEGPGRIRQWAGVLEKAEGRTRTKDPYAPRTLDVDLLLWGDLSVRSKTFELPHPDIRTKAFVLFPLLEIAPKLVMPGTREPLIELAHSFSDKKQSIRRLEVGLLEGWDVP